MTYVLVILISLTNGDYQAIGAEFKTKDACEISGEGLSKTISPLKDVYSVEYDCVPIRGV